MPHFLFFIFVFTNPNEYLPLWLLEGNAVFNESRFGNGGRLYSGESRALFYSLLKYKILNENRLTNLHMDFPFTTEKYIVGGYFFLYLAKKYGIDAVNRLYIDHATHYINPFMVSSSFKRVFGKSYRGLVREFLNFYYFKAEKQKTSKLPSFSKSIFNIELNRDDSEIFFITQNGHTPSILNIVDRKTGSIRKKELDLPSGKVFKLNKRYYSAASGLVNKKRIKFSLWSDSGRDLLNFRSKIVLDVKGHDILWFSPEKSFDRPHLYLNDVEYAITSSSAIMDERKNVYYFKQRDEKRDLYKNKTVIYSFKGRYGKVVDVNSSGGVYYIGATKYGSTLYLFEKGKNYRLSPSDVITDAKLLHGGKLLISEIKKNGYYVTILSPLKKTSTPKGYNYFFESDPENSFYSLYRERSKNPKKAKLKSYNMLRELKYVGAATTITYAFSNVDLSLDTAFSDPLLYNTISLKGVKGTIYGLDKVNLTYLNSKYLINWFLAHEREWRYPTTENVDRIKAEEAFSGAGIIYPLMKRGDHLMNFIQTVGHDDQKAMFEGLSTVHYNYNRHYGLSYKPYQEFDFLISHQRDEVDEFTSNIWSKYLKSFKYDFSLGIDGTIKQNNEYELEYSGVEKNFGTPVGSGQHSLYARPGIEKIAGRVGVELTKNFHTDLYFSKCPISLVTLAPKIMANHFFNKVSGVRDDFQEIGLGIEAGLLMFHLFPMRLSITTFKRESDKESISISLGYNLLSNKIFKNRSR